MQFPTNHSQVKKLLIIENLEKETIYGIVGRMELLTDYFRTREQYRPLLPFLMTYYYVTKEVADTYITHKHFFTSTKELEKQDVYFASLYFTPLLEFLETGKTNKPWQTYFRYCKQPEGLPFLQLLLGINAHINGDLCQSISHLHYTYHKDFLLINDILIDVIPKVMQYLAFGHHDIFGTSGMVFKKFMVHKFHRIIKQWRLTAWENAQEKNQKQATSYIAKKTEEIGKECIDLFSFTYMFEHPLQVVKVLQSLSVALPPPSASHTISLQ